MIRQRYIVEVEVAQHDSDLLGGRVDSAFERAVRQRFEGTAVRITYVRKEGESYQSCPDGIENCPIKHAS